MLLSQYYANKKSLHLIWNFQYFIVNNFLKNLSFQIKNGKYMYVKELNFT